MVGKVNALCGVKIFGRIKKNRQDASGIAVLLHFEVH
jgi:hypothetical protein